MANYAAGMILKNGSSFTRLLCRRVVDRPSNVNVYNKDHLSLINPTQQLYLQRPILGDGFNFVDFVLGKDQELLAQHWKSSAVVEALGKQGRLYDSEEEVGDYADDDANEFESDEHEELSEVEDDSYFDDDDDDDDDDSRR